LPFTVYLVLNPSLLKAKIVRQETSAIDAQFDKKRKQAEVSWKMYYPLSLVHAALS
jgi:V-type H+-transporting ATPase subunit E